jgi:hypothetical protein
VIPTLTNGNRATIFGIVGGALVAVGGTVFLISRTGSHEHAALSLTLRATQSSFGAAFSGHL